MMGRGFGGGPGGFPGGGGGLGGPGMHPGFGRGGGFFLLHGLPMLFVVLGVLVALGVAGWYLFRKAGYEGGLGLLLAIPVVNVGVLLFLALAEWPVLRELQYRRVAMGDAPAPYPYQPPPAQEAPQGPNE